MGEAESNPLADSDSDESLLAIAQKEPEPEPELEPELEPEEVSHRIVDSALICMTFSPASDCLSSERTPGVHELPSRLQCEICQRSPSQGMSCPGHSPRQTSTAPAS